MKKFFALAALAISCMTANAQVWLGGELELSSSHVCNSENTNSVYSIKPEIGTSLTDNIDLAIALGYGHTTSTTGVNVAGYAVTASTDVNVFEINPYIRYKFVKAGNFFAFVDGGIDFASSHTVGTEGNNNAFGVAIKPGIGYAVSDKVTLVSHLGDGLYFAHGWNTEYGNHSNSYGLKLANAISFGAYVTL